MASGTLPAKPSGMLPVRGKKDSGMPGVILVALIVLGLFSAGNLALTISLWQSMPVQKVEDAENPLMKNLAADERLRAEIKELKAELDRVKDLNRKAKDDLSVLNNKVEGTMSAISRVESVANRNAPAH